MSLGNELARGEVGEAHGNPRATNETVGDQGRGTPRWNELMEEVVARDNLARAMKRVRKAQEAEHRAG